tara:strand:- start:134 stop:481 length:348 start_codon:yes stop_codon:yes gene_type:complete
MAKKKAFRFLLPIIIGIIFGLFTLGNVTSTRFLIKGIESSQYSNSERETIMSSEDFDWEEDFERIGEIYLFGTKIRHNYPTLFFWLSLLIPIGISCYLFILGEKRAIRAQKVEQK